MYCIVIRYWNCIMVSVIFHTKYIIHISPSYLSFSTHEKWWAHFPSHVFPCLFLILKETKIVILVLSWDSTQFVVMMNFIMIYAMCLIVISFTWKPFVIGCSQMYDDVGYCVSVFVHNINENCCMLQEGEKYTHTHLVNNV